MRLLNIDIGDIALALTLAILCAVILGSKAAVAICHLVL